MSQQEQKPNNEEEEQEYDSDSDSDSSSSSESSTASIFDEPPYDPDNDPIPYVRRDGTTATIPRGIFDDSAENTPEANLARYNKVLKSNDYLTNQERYERQRKEDELNSDDPFDFPPDPENWREEDLMEYWGDAPYQMTKPGWDPKWVDEEEIEIINEEIKEGRDPPIAPFYVPYRKFYPVIASRQFDRNISTPKAVIEELDRIEEFLKWVSFIFPDGSSYEGTVWDDVAHGKGVYIAENGLVRYEGEWLQNQMEGHGVIEVDIPTVQPIPGSELEDKMRANGEIITRDFLYPEDREWLEKDIEDSVALADGEYEIPWYENDEWVRHFGKKPEKGRYRYAGQWKHGRFHGCGVYEVNERTTYGRFYFGEKLLDPTGCDADISGLHAGIAEVAAAKARMFVNKPNGMVREYNGPYSDPQHPYLYEEEDVWMAPGFINQFYEVPDYWKNYVSEVDEEREMWLNSFHKAPLRLPMPSELEYWWANDEKPEFVLINKEPEPDPEDPSKRIYTEDPLILHTPTGRIINYVEDEEHGIRLFWQPPLQEGEDVDPDKIEFLPLGFDEFNGVEETDKPVSDEKKPVSDRLDKLEEKKKASAAKLEQLKREFELADTVLDLKEANEDLAEVYKTLEEEEANGEDEDDVEEEEEEEEEDEEVEDISISEPINQLKETPAEAEEEGVEAEEEDDEEEEDDSAPSSFGTIGDQNPASNDGKGSSFGKSTFAATSLSFAGSNLVSLIPSNLQQSFSRWKQGKIGKQTCPSPSQALHQLSSKGQYSSATVSFPRAVVKPLKMRYTQEAYQISYSPKFRSRNRPKRRASIESGGEWEQLSILSLHTPIRM